MGLFSFLKNAGAKVMTKKNIQTVETKETKALQEELLKKQKLYLLEGIVKSHKIRVKNLELDLNGEVVTVYGQTERQSDKEKLILALGNVSGISAVDDRISVTNPKPEAEFYVVKRGDTLSKIAKKYYGDATKYNKIFKANRPLLQDPNKIYPGQSLRIPK